MTRTVLPAWLRDPRGAPVVLPFTYAAVLIFSEAGLVQNHHVLAGAIIDAVLVLILVNAVQDPASRGARLDSADAAMRALAVVALSRVIAIGLPLRDASGPVATLGVALLVAGATLGIARVSAVSIRALLVPRALPLQRLGALAGLVLGFVAYLLGAPRLWASGDPPGRVFLGLLAGLAAALVEEVLFRGLLLVSLRRVAARAGVAASCALFAATYLGAGSPGLVLVIAIAGVVFAGVVARSNSLIGALAGHVLLALGAGALWPALFGVRNSHLGESAWIIVALALVLVALGRSVWPRAVVSEPSHEPATVARTEEHELPIDGAHALPDRAHQLPIGRAHQQPIDRALSHGHDEAVLVCLRRLGLPALLDPAPGRERDLCVAAISQLLLSPNPIRDTPLTVEVTEPTLRIEMGGVEISAADLDGALRWLGRRKARIERQLVARHLEPDIGVPVYDIRVVAGHVLGVLSDSRGLAVAAQGHAGESRDPAALPAAVEALRARLGLGVVIVTCDERAALGADISRLHRVPGWIVVVRDPESSAGPSPGPGGVLIAAGEEPDDARVLRVGGRATEMTAADARLRYAEAVAPELRFAPPAAHSLASRNGALTAATLAAYVAWHLREAWAELTVLAHRIPEPALHVLALGLIDQRVPAQSWSEALPSDRVG